MKEITINIPYVSIQQSLLGIRYRVTWGEFSVEGEVMKSPRSVQLEFLESAINGALRHAAKGAIKLKKNK